MGRTKRRGLVALALVSLGTAGCVSAENAAAPLEGKAGTAVSTTAKTEKQRAEHELAGLTEEYFRVLTGLYFNPATRTNGPQLHSVAAGDGYLYTKADVDGMRARGATASGDPLTVVKLTVTRVELPTAGPATATATVCFDAPKGFVTKYRKGDGSTGTAPGIGRRQLVLEYRNQGWPAAKAWREKDGWRIVRNSLMQDKKSGECDVR